MSIEDLRSQGYRERNEKKLHIWNKTFNDANMRIAKYGPKQQKPIEYDGEYYQSKKQCALKLKIPESRLNRALKAGELDGKPIKHISKEAFFKASSKAF